MLWIKFLNTQCNVQDCVLWFLLYFQYFSKSGAASGRRKQRSRGCSAYWGGSCSRFLMFLQVYGRQVFDALPVKPVPGFVLLGEEQWFKQFQKLEQIVSSAVSLLSSHTDICFLVPPICGPSSSAISWVAAVVFSLTLRFVNGRRNTLVFKWGIHNVSGKYQFSAKYHPNVDIFFLLLIVVSRYWICMLTSNTH